MNSPRITGRSPAAPGLVSWSAEVSRAAEKSVHHPAATVFEAAPSYGIFELLDPTRGASQPLSGFWARFPQRPTGPSFRVLQLDAAPPLFAEVGLPAPQPDAVEAGTDAGQEADPRESFFRLLGFDSDRAQRLARRHGLVPTLADQGPRLSQQARALAARESDSGRWLTHLETDRTDDQRMPFLRSLAFLRALGHRWNDGLRALRRLLP
ncbi:MAG: hypothetical protein AAF604_10060 [Acidobacteriota bacterium]